MILPQKIVIAGAGIVGNSIAYYLTKNYPSAFHQPNDGGGNNLTITLIDPVGICPGASSKAGGLLAKTWRDGTPEEELHQLGFKLHDELAEDLGAGAIDYRRLTCTNVAYFDDDDDQELNSGSGGSGHSSRKVQTVGDLEWVDEGGNMGSAPMGDESDMAQVHPKKLCDEMWKTTSSTDGVDLRIGRVMGVTLDDDSPTLKGVTLDDGSFIEADVLVVAIGPWTEEMRDWFGSIPNWDGDAMVANLPPITGVKSHSMLVRSDPVRVLSEAVFFESNNEHINDIEVYPRPDGDSYVTGSEQLYATMTERPGAEAVEPERIHELTDSMKRTSPGVLGWLEPHTVQACYWPQTQDGMPVIGPLPGVEGVYVATGHSVWGILQGPATGAVMADVLMTGGNGSTMMDLKRFGMGEGRMGLMDWSNGGNANGSMYGDDDDDDYPVNYYGHVGDGFDIDENGYGSEL